MDGLLHDKFDVEARRISSILNIWDFGFLVGALKKFAHEEPHLRMQLVLKDYFKQADSNVSLSALQSDANIIRGIFPECSTEDLIMFLREVGNEENRVRIVVKQLLSQSRSKTRKRASSDDACEDDATTSKKSKVVWRQKSDDNTNEDEVCEGPSAAVGSSKSPATEIHQSAQSESTIIDLSSYGSQEVLVREPKANLPRSPLPEQVQRPNDRQFEIDRILQYLTSGTNSKNRENGTDDKNVTIVDDDEPAEQEVEVVTQVTEQKPRNEAIENPPVATLLRPFQQPDQAPPIDRVGETGIPEATTTATLDRSVPSTSGATASTVVVQDAVTSTSDSSEKSNEGKYNLYRHLKEMFSNVSKKDIKAVCDGFNTSKREKPSEKRFNAIVTTLLSMYSESTSDEQDDEWDKSPPSDAATTTRRIIRIIKRAQTHVATIEDRGPTSANREVTQIPQNVGAVETAPIRSQQRTTQHQDAFELGMHTALTAAITENANQIASTIVPAAISATVATSKNRTLPPEGTLLQGHRETLNQVLRDLGEQVSSEDEAVQEVSDSEEAVADNALVYPLMEMFPEACPGYIRQICTGRSNAPGVLDDLISRILEADHYPKRQKIASPERQLNSDEQLEILKQVLPDADPSYLEIHCDRLIDKPNELKLFIEQAIEHRNYPTMKDYLRRQQLSAQQKQYTTEFSVVKFLEVIPSPAEYFSNAKRNPAKIDYEDQHYALCFLRNRFNKVSLRSIREAFRNMDFLKTCTVLEAVRLSEQIKSKRADTPMPAGIQNIPLLQEIAYYEHRSEIEAFLNLQKSNEAKERADAKQAGLLQTCSCCFDEEVMPKDIYTCEEGCVFCKECVRRGAEVTFGDGKLNFDCLNNCSSHFSLQTLQAVLQPKMFSKVALKKQVEEVQAAGIEDLETCPFCDFATIPAKEDKLFRCFNPECMKESCRLCKEPSHVPLRCDEVEKDDDVKRRTYIENKMTEALLRKCYKCGMKFIKAEGCNKMTCSCGALMCYVCGQPVKDYKHFNGPGGEQMHLCPLYSDTNQLHQDAVLKGAAEAKQEIGVTDPAQLKIDPTADIQQHYKQIGKKNPPPPYAQPLHVNPFQALGPQVQIMQQRALQRLEQLRHQQQHNRHQHQHGHRRHHH